MVGYISSDDEELILITAACLALEEQREKSLLMSPNAREMTLPAVLRSDWLIVPTWPGKSNLNRICSNFWIVRLTRFRDTRVGSDSLLHNTIYSVARHSGVFLRVHRTVWRGLMHLHFVLAKFANDAISRIPFQL